MEANWRDLHGKVIKEFLSYINEQTESFILKGGTALIGYLFLPNACN